MATKETCVDVMRDARAAKEAVSGLVNTVPAALTAARALLHDAGDLADDANTQTATQFLALLKEIEEKVTEAWSLSQDLYKAGETTWHAIDAAEKSQASASTGAPES